MILAVVEGNLVSTVKDESYNGRRLMIVQPINPDGTATGSPSIAVDSVGSGIGDIVLCVNEGGSAQMMLDNKNIPLQMVIAGVVDGISCPSFSGQ
ncbi:MAG: ethanolamine utilization protein EutN [Candidatus Wallbacteria bacterium HGW-Wallbacteria-1]|jgi:ethanolamine utilization protein EutN|uniref:Ethanolamine utilization protein EutN n=1 Tax=Candidatus Wallbacteria bacterium HGW-Wallbacteria-1 TaxID=2013854 RepID=A0A2N1PJX0_9BACT|nr:MAG: ethanolamine utilization protein EutN [Candidatus Wallbacteria bacterium HGW-Wallbacteria-1]